VIWVAGFYTAGFYSLETFSISYKRLAFITVVAAIGMLVGFSFFYLMPWSGIRPQTVIVLYSGISVCLIVFWRWAFRMVSVNLLPKTKIAFAGINDTVIELLQHKDMFSSLGYDLFCILEEDYSKEACCEIPVVRDSSQFVREIVENKIRMVVLAGEKNLSQEMRSALYNLLQHHVRFINIPDFYETHMRKIPIGSVNELWFLLNIDLDAQNIYRAIKRVTDIFIALVFSLITIPFWPFIMLIIKLESPGPVFFKQIRAGVSGKPFAILKFRSMKMDNNTFEPTAQKDSRITPFGNFMRKTRIDELPQFLNILKGDMSFIGPRPERPDLILELEKEVPFYRQRMLVKPGITGWDQVSGEYHSPSIEDTYKKLQCDLYYIKNMTFWLDGSIFFKTIKIVLRMAGR
jgi:exopolysaccharide biosynthesis polyprenyl glycosylphosphotransferase